MPRTRKPAVSPRKQPIQARSAQMVTDILAAAIRVLEREGAARFTTIRVAETAGISVGSLYQYFPNKEAILFRLQVDEWAKTGGLIDGILGDRARSPRERLHAVIHAFFRSECEEAPLRLALDAATPSYHEADESSAHRQRSRRTVSAFVAEAAPRATPRQRAFAIDLLVVTMTSVGKQVSERQPGEAELQRWSDAVAGMLGAYLAGLSPSARAARSGRSASRARRSPANEAAPRARTRR